SRSSLSDFVLLSFYSAVSFHFLHSFPTRRSSDLAALFVHIELDVHFATERRCAERHFERDFDVLTALRFAALAGTAEHRAEQIRSEEHTSELQSRRDLVCRLLLEKKNRK